MAMVSEQSRLESRHNRNLTNPHLKDIHYIAVAAGADAAVAAGCSCWLLLTAAGCRWQLQVVDRCGLLMAAAGGCRELLTAANCC